MRALEWAVQQSKRRGSQIKDPAVVGAIIQLGDCFDLLDVKFTQMLAETGETLIHTLSLQGIPPPANQSAGQRDYDWLKRERDCFILNRFIPVLEHKEATAFHSVRCAFLEGTPAFEGAGIKLKSHIQIAVRDPRAIIGYFQPEGF